MVFLRLIAIVGCVSLFASCAWFGGDDDEREKTRELTEKQLYDRVQELLEDKSYDLAVRDLQLLESRFPFGNYAEQAQLEIIYAYYKSGDEDAAISAADRFLRLHPQHPDADYAWYMKGLANYRLNPGVLGRFYNPDFAARDVEPARRSFYEFQQFLRRFPDSQYAADARVRMINIKNVLARHEMVVANYYLSRQSYTAAINRANTVVQDFQNTDAVGDALALLVFCYQRSDLPDAAASNLNLLRQNFPDHFALNDDGSFAYGADYDLTKRSLINRMSLGLIDAAHAPVFDSRYN